MQKVSVTRFSEFFAERFEFVENNCLSSIEGWILLCSYIDSIAGYCFGGNSSGPRFRRILVELDITPRLDTISIPSIWYGMAQSSSPDQRFIDFFRKNFGIGTGRNWGEEYNNRCRDTSAANLTEELKKAGLLKGNKLTEQIDECEYSNILWTDYRSCAVHESSLRGKRNYCPDITEPYYFTPIKNSSTNKRDFLFVIPPVYLLKTVKACIEFVENRLRRGHSLEKIE